VLDANVPHCSLVTEHAFEFRGLAALPCGCVAADYFARLLSLDLAAVEAKGAPHCTVGHHASGSLLAPDEHGRGTAASWV